MKEPTDILGRMRVASPCGVSWDSMEGDGRVCFCRLCSLNVYDFSEMTRAEVEALVFKTEGRLCGRLTRRADGTVLTKDCPVGLRALRLRTTRAAGAAFAALLGLFAAVSGRPAPRQAGSCPSGGARFKVERKTQSGSYSTVSGTVYDERCALIYGAAVSLKSKETGRKFETKSSDDGEFLFAAVPSGTYTIEITSPGFIVFHRDDFHVGGSEAARVGVVLEVGMMGEIITVEEPKTRPAIESRPGSTVIRDKMLTDLPLPPGEEK